jgi:3-hydroxybutyryl-CoA dehydrogenase/5-formyl-3-hydroxy-2-methylpyridine 4-carboxylate dehydrogenase
VRGVLDRLKITGDDAPLSFHGTLEETVAGADLVIENVPERIEVKEQVFRAIDALVGPGTILASDTSGIPITKLQAFVSRPERLAGMHWSNPPHIIPMIEVIAGERTAPATVDFLVRTIEGMGLIPVKVKRDVAGFVENRVLYAVMRECLDLVEQGVIDAEGLDTIVSWGIGYKLSVVGPMALLDMAGLDIYQSVASYLNPELSNRADVSGAITVRTAEGRLGIKSGGGLFDYSPERVKALQAERAKKLVATRLALEGRG